MVVDNQNEKAFEEKNLLHRWREMRERNNASQENQKQEQMKNS